MASGVLTTATSLQCPHGGTVKVVSSNTRTKAGAHVLRSTDTFTIAGCTFAPGGTASPCVTVRWTVSDSRVTVLGAPTLSEASVGLCSNAAQAPQGTVIGGSNATSVSTV